MPQGTYPVWVSHTSMRDFLSCPRAYFLRQVYKDPKTKKKINIVNPALALGNSVHDVLESLTEYKAEERMEQPLLEQFEKEWAKFAGPLGGFKDEIEERVYKERGIAMIQRVIENPGPLRNKALKLHSPDTLPPRYLLSIEDNILLCGKIDWLEYFPEDNSVHIIDFKTGLHEEEVDSLQLPIYALLVKNCQQRLIRKISYWYLEKSNEPIEMPLPDFEEAHENVLRVAKQMKQARAEGVFVCRRNGCFACKPLEKIINGEARFIRTSGYQDIYALD
jgi:ATP-dependent helicase/DNAse subunit B